MKERRRGGEEIRAEMDMEMKERLGPNGGGATRTARMFPRGIQRAGTAAERIRITEM